MIKESLVYLRSLAGAALLTAGLLAGVSASAQDSNTSIGAPQLRDFQLEPKQRIVTQPAQPAPTVQQPAARPPATAATTPQTQPQPAQQRPAPTTRTVQAAPLQARTPALRTADPAGAAVAPAPSATAPATDFAAASATALPAPEPASLPAPAVPITGSSTTLSEGPPLWLYFLAFVTVGLLGYGYWLRRQAMERRALAIPAPIPAPSAPRAPAAPRPDPVPRPWLELELKPQRAHIDVEESVIEFELTIRNSGGSVARGINLQARMFCSTPKQDEELGAYFKSRPGDHKTITIPDIPAGGELAINGSVDIKRDRMSALQVENKLLFVPLIGVNAFYGWGTARSGQTSRSFVIGREREADKENERMGAFRMDMGARVYRTIGQRAHKVNKRV